MPNLLPIRFTTTFMAFLLMVTAAGLPDAAAAAAQTRVGLFGDIEAGPTSSQPGAMVASSGYLYFHATTAEHGVELWRTDGASAPRLVADLEPGADSAFDFTPTLGVFDGKVYFTAQVEGSSSVLYYAEADGAPVPMHPADPQADLNRLTFSFAYGFRQIGDDFYFLTDGPSASDLLWRSDGTGAGTELIYASLVSQSTSLPVELEDKVYFLSFDLDLGYALYAVAENGEPELVFDQGLTGAHSLTVFDGKLYFVGSTDALGEELWQVDPSGAGTAIEIVEGSSGGTPASLTSFGERLYFSAEDSEDNGRELWFVEAGSSEPQRVDINLNEEGNSSPNRLQAYGGRLYFVASNGISGRELWSINEEHHIAMVKDISAGSGRSDPTDLTGFQGLLYFVANDGVSGRELWVTDGTGEATIRVADIVAGEGGSSPGMLTSFGGRLYFQANDGVSGQELWALGSSLQQINIDGAGDVVFEASQGVLQTLSIDPPEAASPSFEYPFGFFDFSVTGLTPGGTVTVSLTLPDGAAPTHYIKCENGGSCAAFPGAVIAGNVITLTLTDGGAGDDDGVADGIIRDPGAPAVGAGPGAAPPSDGGAINLTLLLSLTGLLLFRRLKR